MKYDLTHSVEGLATDIAVPSFEAFVQIYNNLCKRLQRQISKGIVSIIEFSCSKMAIAVYEQTGGLFSKQYSYVEDVDVTDDEFFALRQFYYRCHTTFYGKIFNIVDITFESKGSKLVVNYGVGYNPKWDGEASSGSSTKHIAPSPFKPTKASLVAGLDDERALPTNLSPVKI